MLSSGILDITLYKMAETVLRQIQKLFSIISIFYSHFSLKK